MRQTRKREGEHEQKDQALAQAAAPVTNRSGRRAEFRSQGTHAPLDSLGSRCDGTTPRSIPGHTNAPQRRGAP